MQSFQKPLSCLASNNPTLDTSPLDTLHKHLPKNIMTDKEALYEENLALKHNQNRLRENNQALFTKYSHLQKEFVKTEGQLVNAIGARQSNLQKRDQSHTELLKNFRITINSQQQTIQSKEAEITRLKKSVKYTSIRELQIDLQQY